MARSPSSNVALPDTSIHEVSGRPLVLNLLTSLRPAQWTKNLLVFAGLIFRLKLFFPAAVVEAGGVRSSALSGRYLINDVLDRENDRRHR
jgi:4-hydroxybenzoate polyprenyltransferase